MPEARRPDLVRGDRNRLDLTRRGFLAGAGAATLGLVAAACGSTASPATATGVGGGPWSFTDDRGVTVRMHGRPNRVVA